VLLSAAGPYGPILLVVLGVGFLVQFALAAMVAFGRRVPAALAVAVPALVLLLGGAGALYGIEEAITAVAGAADPSWIPWFALQDRARIGGTAAAAGVGALLLTLPPLMGAAVASLRARQRRWFGPAFGALVALAAAAGAVAAAAWTGDAPRGVLAGLALAALGTAAAGCGLDAAPRRMTNSGIGAASFAIGSLALVVGQLGEAWYRGLGALPDFDAVWSRVGALDAHAAAVAAVLPSLVPFVAAAALGLLPALLVQRLRGLDTRSGVDIAAAGGTGLAVALMWAWVPFRWSTLSHLAGDHTAAVLEERRGYDVPHRALVPPRVLVADPARPRWVLARDAGGVELADVVGDLAAAAASLQLGDGLILPPHLPMEDLYFNLADTRAGGIAVVGCGNVSTDQWLAIGDDPLRATGRCGAFPIRLRLDSALRSPRKLIVLKDRLVDDGGDIVPIAEVGDLEGRAVVVRAQVDATAGDLLALLARLGDAGSVYLGWGVTLDGDSLPIGVNPGVRVRSVTPPSPNGEGVAIPPAD